ncbi:MAG: FAD-binding oxidoreductase [Woeseiaceae bacterium]
METPFSDGASSRMPRSLWAATTARPEPYPILQGIKRVDVCIIGGGIMGLSTALALASEGKSVAVVEATEIGWGASGRNNGLVAPGLKRDPWEVRKVLGADKAGKLLAFAGAAPDRVFGLIKEHGIDCDANAGGWIQAAHSRRALSVVERRVREWHRLGIDVDMLPAGNVSEQLGTDFYRGACRYANGGSINPLAYTHGIAQAAAEAGALLHEQSPALQIPRIGDEWHVVSMYGRILSPQVICCTNAYNDNIDLVRGSVMPLRTAQVASHPLPRKVTSALLTGAAAASDTQRLLTSFRLTPDNRLIMGGASATAGDEHVGLMKHLHRAARERFPELGEIPWEYGWSGYLALTPDHLPRIVRHADGFLAPIGCNGRGIAMSTAMGATLAKLVEGMDDEESLVPVTQSRQFTGYGMRHLGVALGVRFNRLLDKIGRMMS